MFDDKKSIEAAKLLQEYCIDAPCDSCIFNFTNMQNCDYDGCMFNGEDTFPYTWETHLIEKG